MASTEGSYTSQPINATFLRRLATRAAPRWYVCELGNHDWRSKIPFCRRFYIKHSRYGLAEAHSIDFVARNTTIPVPKIYCAFARKGIYYTVMQKLPGKMLVVDWNTRSGESRAKILRQLKDMVAQLRAPPPPPMAGVSSVIGGLVYDCRLPTRDLHGPFADVQEFHRYLRQGYDDEYSENAELDEIVKLHKGSWPICFTHGDLSSLNIIAKGDEITGIVDWETAGWYPSYWEYATAWNVNVYNVFWREHIDAFIDPMPEELKMERLRNALFGYDWHFLPDESYDRLFNSGERET